MHLKNSVERIKQKNIYIHLKKTKIIKYFPKFTNFSKTYGKRIKENAYVRSRKRVGFKEKRKNKVRKIETDESNLALIANDNTQGTVMLVYLSSFTIATKDGNKKKFTKNT